MPVAKRRKAPTPNELAAADRAARARAANPPRDPTGAHHLAIAELARETGRDVTELLDSWDERAAMREYAGEANRAESERLAVEDVRTQFVRQGVLL